MISVVIKENVFGGELWCGLCGASTRTRFGPDLFLEGTMQVLCHECARDYSPDLVQLVEGATIDASRSPNWKANTSSPVVPVRVNVRSDDERDETNVF